MELCLLHTQKKNCCTLKKKIEQISSKVLTLKTASGHQKKNLHVRESNPGRLRDRQKCYQLHQRGQPPARIELATLRLLSACSARLSYRGICSRPGSNWRPWDYETHALPTAPQELLLTVFIRITARNFAIPASMLRKKKSQKKNVVTPTVGLEPTTTRLRVLRSTN